jgi:divalent metal cation (Fe/Co/Zn/Cd) transporter
MEYLGWIVAAGIVLFVGIGIFWWAWKATFRG